MSAQYYHLRPEKAESFNVKEFIDKLQDDDRIDYQLDLLDEYFNVIAMRRTITIASDEGVRFTYHIEEEDDFSSDGTPTTMGKILTEWRLKRAQTLNEYTTPN